LGVVRNSPPRPFNGEYNTENPVAVRTEPEHGTDAAEFSRFARELEPRLRYALAARLPSEAATDATQEALIYAWRHWERVRAMANPGGYLYTIAKRRARRTLAGRRTRVLGEVPVEDPPPGEPGLTDALRRLSAMQRRVVYLVEGLGLSQQEAAEFLGIGRTTVQRHRERALRHLRHSLGVFGDE
jgi:DNA-directed RNA polymerase specialized sigma24 family protein